jgi:hypothetical protein
MLAANVQSFLNDTFLDDEDVRRFHADGFVLKRKCFDEEDMLPLERELSSSLSVCLGELEVLSSSEGKGCDEERSHVMNGSRVVYKLREPSAAAAARSRSRPTPADSADRTASMNRSGLYGGSRFKVSKSHKCAYRLALPCSVSMQAILPPMPRANSRAL